MSSGEELVSVLDPILHDDQGYILASILSFLHVYEMTTSVCYVNKNFLRSSKIAFLRNESGFSRDEYADMFIRKGIGRQLLKTLLLRSKTFNLNIRFRVKFAALKHRFTVEQYCYIRQFVECLRIFMEKHRLGVRGFLARNKIHSVMLLESLGEKPSIQRDLLYEFLDDGSVDPSFNDFVLLRRLAMDCSVEAMKVVLSHSRFTTIPKYPVQPLLISVRKGDTAMVKFLLNTGKIDLNGLGGGGERALKIAAQCGYADIVDLLLETVQDIDLASDEYFAMRRAARYGHSDVVRVLLRHTRHPLRILRASFDDAAKFGFVETCSILLRERSVSPLRLVDVDDKVFEIASSSALPLYRSAGLLLWKIIKNYVNYKTCVQYLKLAKERIIDVSVTTTTAPTFVSEIDWEKVLMKLVKR